MTTVLLIHGAVGSAAQVRPFVPLLAVSHDVHVVELEGHGQTPLIGDRYRIDGFADNVRAFMRANAIERAAIFGHSMGGYVALHLAAESPELVSSVATLGTKLVWTPAVAAKEASRLDPAAIRAKVPQFAAALERRHAGAGGWESVLARTAALMTELGAHPVVTDETFARIQQRVRLMVGHADNVATIDETAAAARMLAHGELCVLPRTPHPLEQVRPPLLTGLLVDFFAESR